MSTRSTLNVKWVRLCVVALALLAPQLTLAQEVVVLPPPPVVMEPQQLAPELVPRLRLEVGLEGGFIVDGPFTSEASYGLGPGTYFRLGAQITERFGVQAEASVAMIPSLYPVGYLRGAVTFNFTPVRWFTLSTGPVVGLLFDDSDYAGLTIRTDFHLAQVRTAKRRHSLTLGFSADLGADLGNSGGGLPDGVVGGMVHLGYTVH
jgi:hypothetical protein